MAKYFVYVIELDPLVADLRKFRKKNPGYIKGNGCVYVGQSSRRPELRFEQHKEGYKSNNYAHEVLIDGPCKIVYSPGKPLSCGAKVWIETENNVTALKDNYFTGVVI